MAQLANDGTARKLLQYQIFGMEAPRSAYYSLAIKL